MALWGNDDNKALNTSAGIVTVSGTTVTGTATTFTNFSVGDVITVGAGGSQGFAVIASIASTVSMTLVDTDALASDIAGAQIYSVGERPKYLDEDPLATSAVKSVGIGSTSLQVYGVDETMVASRVATGSQYKPAHAGWVGIQTYVDCHGNLRVKSETYVAMSGITTQTQETTHVLPA